MNGFQCFASKEVYAITLILFDLKCSHSVRIWSFQFSISFFTVEVRLARVEVWQICQIETNDTICRIIKAVLKMLSVYI